MTPTDLTIITVGDTQLTVTEADAIQLFQALRQAFGWASVLFSRSDIADALEAFAAEQGDDLYTDDQLAAAVDTVMNHGSWAKWMPDAMINAGDQTLTEIISTLQPLAAGAPHNSAA